MGEYAEVKGRIELINKVRRVIELGVEGFWNFTHYDISLLHPEVSVENVHLNDTLARLSYKIKNNK